MSKTILLIDDDEEYVAALTCILDARGYRVVSAPSGADGLAAARREPPDAVILDNMMETDLAGIETARALAADTTLGAVPVIMVTAMRQAMNLPFPVKPDGAWLPVVAVLEKPVPKETLLATLERVLAD